MIRRIIVPLDRSETSESALPLARTLASQHNLIVTLVTVLDSPEYLPDTDEGRAPEHFTEPWDDQRAMRGSLPFGPGSATTPLQGSELETVSSDAAGAADYLGRIAETFSGVTVQTVIQHGDPVQHVHHLSTISSRVEEPSPATEAAVVMASHGRTGFGRALLGSVAWRVVQGSRVPVFLVRASTDQGAPRTQYDLSRVVIALDGSSFAEEVLSAAQYWLGDALKTIHLVRVADSHRSWLSGELETREADGRSPRDEAEEYLSTLSDRLRARGYAVDWEVDEGDVAERLNETAEASDAGLLALATHGRSGLDRMRVGSVAEKVLQHATRPLLVVRPQGQE